MLTSGVCNALRLCARDLFGHLGGKTLNWVSIRSGTLANDFVPILCGSAFKNKGVQPMLDAVIAFLPSPLDIEPAHGVEMKGGEEHPITRGPEDPQFAALAFKIVSDPFGKRGEIEDAQAHSSSLNGMN